MTTRNDRFLRRIDFFTACYAEDWRTRFLELNERIGNVYENKAQGQNVAVWGGVTSGQEVTMIQKRMGKQELRTYADVSRPVSLPKPALLSSMSLAEALKIRKTTREISPKKLPLQTLSNLLWAACGVNRRKGPFGIPGRTAASASNSQEVDVYVALEEAAYLYDPFHHRLMPVVALDLRRFAISRGQAPAGADAPVRLIYVADIDKLVHTAGYQEPGLRKPNVQRSYYYVDTGLIAANVYLFAASTGLAAWFHNCDKAQLSAKLNLRKDQLVLFGQTVGYAAKRRLSTQGRS